MSTTHRSRPAFVYAQILAETGIFLAPAVPHLKSQITSPNIGSVAACIPFFFYHFPF